jgi:hypothetical protein
MAIEMLPLTGALVGAAVVAVGGAVVGAGAVVSVGGGGALVVGEDPHPASIAAKTSPITMPGVRKRRAKVEFNDILFSFSQVIT